MESTKYTLTKILSVGLRAAHEAAFIIKDIHEKKELHTEYKGFSPYPSFMPGENDPVTQADIRIQFIAERAFKHYFPDLPFVGIKSPLIQ